MPAILAGHGLVPARGIHRVSAGLAGKLFPGPHLYAGAAIVVLWALAASMVPAMQKGNDTARNAHIAFNALNVGLFLWQVPTGLDIVYKVSSSPAEYHGRLRL